MSDMTASSISTWRSSVNLRRVGVVESRRRSRSATARFYTAWNGWRRAAGIRNGINAGDHHASGVTRRSAPCSSSSDRSRQYSRQTRLDQVLHRPPKQDRLQWPPRVDRATASTVPDGASRRIGEAPRAFARRESGPRERLRKLHRQLRCRRTRWPCPGSPRVSGMVSSAGGSSRAVPALIDCVGCSHTPPEASTFFFRLQAKDNGADDGLILETIADQVESAARNYRLRRWRWLTSTPFQVDDLDLRRRREGVHGQGNRRGPCPPTRLSVLNSAPRSTARVFRSRHFRPSTMRWTYLWYGAAAVENRRTSRWCNGPPASS